MDLRFEYNNLYINLNNISYVENKEQLLQNIFNRLQTNKGEFLLDINYGMQYSDIFAFENKTTNEETMLLAIRECILQEENIVSIDSLTVTDIDNRQKQINFTATTTYNSVVEGGVTIG